MQNEMRPCPWPQCKMSIKATQRGPEDCVRGTSFWISVFRTGKRCSSRSLASWPLAMLESMYVRFPWRVSPGARALSWLWKVSARGCAAVCMCVPLNSDDYLKLASFGLASCTQRHSAGCSHSLWLKTQFNDFFSFFNAALSASLFNTYSKAPPQVHAAKQPHCVTAANPFSAW